jgi:hypothetical protein
MDCSPLFERINKLAAQEEKLWQRAGDGGGLDPGDVARLDTIKVEVDQAYDLLHQRQARHAAGLDLEDPSLRPEEIVERYQQ